MFLSPVVSLILMIKSFDLYISYLAHDLLCQLFTRVPCHLVSCYRIDEYEASV